MKLLVIALAAALTILYLKRRRRPEPWSAPMPEPSEPTPRSVPTPQSESPTEPTEPVSPVDAPIDEAVTAPFAFEQGTVPGPEARERESEVTEETRYDRLGQVEQDERSDAAARLRDDPLVRRNEDETP